MGAAQKKLDVVRAGDGDERHGRASTYSNHFCRCDPCREAWSAYRRELRNRRQRQAQGGAA